MELAEISLRLILEHSILIYVGWGRGGKILQLDGLVASLSLSRVRFRLRLPLRFSYLVLNLGPGPMILVNRLDAILTSWVGEWGGSRGTILIPVGDHLVER